MKKINVSFGYRFYFHLLFSCNDSQNLKNRFFIQKLIFRTHNLDFNKEQMVWKIYSLVNIPQKLNEDGLRQKYQNQIEDLNTYTLVAPKTLNFFSETQVFLNQLLKEMNFKTILLQVRHFGLTAMRQCLTLIC